ncbi:MAG: FtsQ-type POTRA domain-containing protein [Desulfovibrio sp.]
MLSSLWLYNRAITSDFFTTRHVDVTGNVRLSHDMVLQYGGIREGDNSLAVSIARLKETCARPPGLKKFLLSAFCLTGLLYG